ncbi:MAG: hypothetical protein BZY77_02750 [SAR202 cluster bacterium Io17-Chloro-G5]|nr:MAG: hypothetical protein BZY77_02750 [SAR202 cluster bacterium Io17-Chloro-G5]
MIEASDRRPRLLFRKYRQSRSVLSDICPSSPPSELADQTNLLDAIIDSPEQGRTIDRYMSLEVALFSQSRIIGPLVWPGLGSIDLWRRKIGAEIVGGLAPAGVLDFLMTDYSKDLLLPLVGTVENLDAAKRSHSESVGAKLEAAARWDLLDLGMRNPLLNYRLLRSRGSGLQGHAPQNLIDALYGGGRAKVLVPKNKPNRKPLRFSPKNRPPQSFVTRFLDRRQSGRSPNIRLSFSA